MISQNIKKQIIDQTNIVEVVGEVVKLTKKGSSYFGLCPFHNDNNPSMSVNNEKKMFNCFSCNTKGNVIYFFSRFNNITEDQATISLAKRLGIEVSEATSKEAIREERLLKVMNEATNFYQYYLNNTDEGLVAKEYLTKRGINDELIKKLRIGLAPSESNYLNLALRQKNISELDQTELGLVKIDDNNRAYDVFKTRIIFPIENTVGQVVGFSGRIYTDSNQAKYINSTDNAIFHKGQILYNFHNAANDIRQNNKVIIYEGFMDVIASIKAGLNNAVATMGTALTNDHIKTLLNLTKNITLCFDGDSAGINAMKRSAMMFANFGIIPKAIVLPNNMDPDEYIKAFGVETLNNYFLQNEKNVYNWLFELSRRKYIKDDLESTELFKKEVFEFIRFAKQNTIVEHFIKLLSEEINISVETLMKDYGDNNYKTVFEKENAIENKPIAVKKTFKIKKKVYIAYDKIIKHLINSKDKFELFYDKFRDRLYIDNSLSIQFSIVKKLNIYYADNNYMDEVDFINMTKDMDLADNAKIYEEYAYHIINETMANVKDNNEFQQCIVTLLECYSDLEKNRLYSKVVDTLENNDIKSFEKIKKDTVKIVPKED